jgi:hypothetical protein
VRRTLRARASDEPVVTGSLMRLKGTLLIVAADRYLDLRHPLWVPLEQQGRVRARRGEVYIEDAPAALVGWYLEDPGW